MKKKLLLLVPFLLLATACNVENNDPIGGDDPIDQPGDNPGENPGEDNPVDPIYVNTVKLAYESASGLANRSESSDKYEFTGIVHSKDGKSFFVQDEEYGIYVYNYTNGESIEVGKEVTVKSTLQNYNGCIETKNIESVVVNKNAAPASSVVVSSLTELSSLKQNVKVSFTVEIPNEAGSWSASSSPIVDAKLGEETLKIKFSKMAYTTEKGTIYESTKGHSAIIEGAISTAYNLEGAVDVNQILFVSTSSIELVNNPATSLTLSADKTEVDVGNTVTLSHEVVPNNTTDTVRYEITEGSEYATLEGNTLTATKAGTVKVVAKAGNVTSNVTSIVINEPIPEVIHAESVSLSVDKTDIKVGQTATLSTTVSPSNAVETATYEIIEGNGLVTLNGDTLTATGAGTVKVVAKAGEVTSNEVVITITEVEPEIIHAESVTLVADKTEIEVGDVVTLNATINPTDAVEVATYEITEGTENASLVDNVLTATKSGTVKVVAKAGEVTSNVITITIKDKQPEIIHAESVSLVANNTEIKVGETVTLSATVNPANAVETPAYEIIEGSEYATLSNNILTATAAGTVKVVAKAGEVTSNEVTIVISSNAPVEDKMTISRVEGLSDMVANAYYVLGYEEHQDSEDLILMKNTGTVTPTKGGYFEHNPSKIQVTTMTDVDDYVVTFEEGKTAGTYNIKADGYYVAKGDGTSKDVNLVNKEAAQDFTLSFSNNSDLAAIAFTSDSNTWKLQYNSSSPRFCFYSTSQKMPVIYRVDNYKPATYEVESIILSSEKSSISVGESTTLSATILPTKATGTVNYEIVSGNEYATLSGNTLTGRAAGNVKVVAKVDSVTSNEINISVTSTAASNVTRVNNVNDLVSGANYILGYEATANSNQVILMKNSGTASTSNGYLAAEGEAVDVNSLTSFTDYIVSIEASETSGKYVIRIGDNYIVGADKALRFSTKENAQQLSITIGANSAATISYVASSKTYKLQYNSANPRFCFYSSEQKLPVIYRVN